MPEYRRLKTTPYAGAQEKLLAGDARLDDEENRSQSNTEANFVLEKGEDERDLAERRQNEYDERRTGSLSTKPENGLRIELKVTPDSHLERHLQSQPWQSVRDVLSELPIEPATKAVRADQLPEIEKKIGSERVEPTMPRNGSVSEERTCKIERNDKQTRRDFDNDNRESRDPLTESVSLETQSKPQAVLEIPLKSNVQQYIQNEPRQLLSDVLSDQIVDIGAEPVQLKKSEKIGKDIPNTRIELDIAERCKPGLKDGLPGNQVKDKPARDVLDHASRRSAPAEPIAALSQNSLREELKVSDLQEQRHLEYECWHSLRDVFSEPFANHSTDSVREQKSDEIDRDIANKSVEPPNLDEHHLDEKRLDKPSTHETDRSETDSTDKYRDEDIAARYEYCQSIKPWHALQDLLHEDRSAARWERNEAAGHSQENAHSLPEAAQVPRDIGESKSEPTYLERYERPQEQIDVFQAQRTSIEHDAESAIELCNASPLHIDRENDPSACDVRIAEEPVTREEQFSCTLPVDIANAVIEIGPLEPESVEFLHEKYGYAERHVSDNRPPDSLHSFAEAAVDARESLLSQAHSVCPERTERAQQQIDFLKSVDTELQNSPRTFDYANLIIHTDSANPIYHISDALDAAWTTTDHPRSLQQILDQRVAEADEHGHNRQMETARLDTKLARSQPKKLLTTIERDLKHCENEVNRLEEEEPAPCVFYLVECTNRKTFIERHTAHTIEEFNGVAPDVPVDGDLLVLMVEVDRQYKLWLSRKQKARLQLQGTRDEEGIHRQGPTDDYDHDDFDR
jgi:hypothetical protein